MLKKDKKIAAPTLSILSYEHIDNIYRAAQEVMNRTGLSLPHEDTLLTLKKAGCKIESDVAHIPKNLVDECVKMVPKRIQLYTREGELSLRLGEDISYYGPGVGAPFILDSFNGAKRNFTMRDIEQATLLQDALPNINFVMAVGEPFDIKDHSLSDIYEFIAMLFNTSKPINFIATSAQSLRDIIEMASVVTGDEAKLREKPFLFMFGGGSTPPLAFNPEKLERIAICVDKGIPFVSLSGSGSGGTAPITRAGQLVLTLAELLTAVVVSQTRKEGSPIIVGGIPLLMDMKTNIFSYGAPEFYLSSAAITEILRFFEFPNYGTAGIGDSKIVDEQAAIEATASSYLQFLCRANLIHDIGFLDSGMIGSFEMLAICDEVIGMVRRFGEEIKFDSECLALDIIHDVGPGGNFITHDHTLRHFRENWQPKLICRDNYNRWEERGKKRLTERARETVHSILNDHKPIPLEKGKEDAIKAISNRKRNT
jgi:trimethylamine--corrinoid protein Co-methyltransferase